MSLHAQDIILNSFVLIGVYSPVQTLSATDGAYGLQQLNTIIDKWQDEGLYCQQLISRTLTISNAKASYTIAPNGSPSLTAPRPNAVEMGPGMASCTPSGGSASPVNVVSAVEWEMIQAIGAGTGTPDTMFYDPQYPAGVINLAPTPNNSGTVTFNALQVLSAFADLSSTSYTLANGVQDALQTNLGLSLMPSYAGTRPMSPRLATDAADAKNFLRYGNGNLVSRTMLNRRMISTGRQPAPAEATKGDA